MPAGARPQLVDLQRRLFCLVLTVACLACGGDDSPAPRLAGLPPNLLVVAVDTLRADHLGLYGYPRDTSPNLDALAERCTVFDAAQSVAPWTAPALLSLMTSLPPALHGVRDFPRPGRLAEDVDTLAEVLKRRGYATAAFTEGGYARGEFGLDQGFDVYPANAGDAEGNRSNLIHESRLEGNLDRTLAWIAAHRDEPFFVFFHTYEVHPPLRAPERFIREFRPGWDEAAEHERVARAIEHWNRERRLSEAERELVWRHFYHCRFRGLPPREAQRAMLRYRPAGARPAGSRTLRPDDVRFVTDLYDAEIAYADARLVRLWRVLDELGLRRDTLIVVTSDHGEGLGDHGSLSHGSRLNEEALHVALLFCGAGVAPAPRRVADVVSSLDVMPTVLELLGADEAPPAMRGRSLAPLLAGGSLEARPALSSALAEPLPGRLRSLRTRRWRLVEEPATGRRWLYDLAADPEETANLAAERGDVVSELLPALGDELEHASLHQADAGPVRLDARTAHELEVLGYLE